MISTRRRSDPDSMAGKLPFLEGLRGVAALYVVLGHICSLTDPSALAGRISHAPLWMQSVCAFFSYGHLAVAAFIVISGFCLELSLFQNGDGKVGPLGKFYKRRARRILPAYYACLAISVVVCIQVTSRQSGMPFQLYLPANTETILAHVFMVHNWSVDWMYKLNGVLWSIAIEAQLYVIFPLLVLSITKIGKWWTFLGALVVAGVFMAFAKDAMKLYPWYLPLFVLGMTSAHFAYRPHLRAGTMPWGGRIVGSLLLIGAIAACVLNGNLAVDDLPFGASVACFAYAWTCDPSGIIYRVFSSRPLVALGSFSYSLYLIHHPIEQVLYALRPSMIQDQPSLLAYLVAGLPVILLLAWLFSLLFERPFMRKSAPKSVVTTKDLFFPRELPLRTVTQPFTFPVVSIKAPEGVPSGVVRTEA